MLRMIEPLISTADSSRILQEMTKCTEVPSVSQVPERLQSNCAPRTVVRGTNHNPCNSALSDTAVRSGVSYVCVFVHV